MAVLFGGNDLVITYEMCVWTVALVTSSGSGSFWDRFFERYDYEITGEVGRLI